MVHQAGGAAALPYPDRFFAAAVYAGFPAASPLVSKAGNVSLSNDTSLLLYSLYQQATVGPCNMPKPWSWNVVDIAKWTSWNQLEKMPSTEAMRLFVRTLEEEDAEWWAKVYDEKGAPSNQSVEQSSTAPVQDAASNQGPNGEDGEKLNASEQISLVPAVSESIPEHYSLAQQIASNGSHKKLEEEIEVTAAAPAIVKGDTVTMYNQWFSPQVTGRKPPARYQHAAAIVGEKLYVIGGNHNGRYLNDVQVLDLNSLAWSKLEQKPGSVKNSPQHPFPPCAGHSLIQWDMKLLLVAGHSKEVSDTVTVRAFDTLTSSWSLLPSYGQAPIARGGQSVTKVGTNLVMFGGEDSKRRLYNDLNILDLETMTWDAIDTRGVSPSPRSDHAAAIHADRYLFIFGGGSHSTCFNDLFVLDLETMEWSQPQQQGFVPTPRAGHVGVTVGDNWYIIGGGDNKSGISDTMILNMATLVWHVVTTEKGRTSIASEGLSVEAFSKDSEDSLIAFGGYNGRYSNEVHIFTASPAQKLKQKVLQSPAAAAAAASAAAAFAVPRSTVATMPTVNGGNSGLISDLQSPLPVEDKVPENKVDSSPIENLREVQAEMEEDASTNVTHELKAAALLAQTEASKYKQELAVAILSRTDLEKELLSVRKQLVSEQSRCFQLEVNVAELRQKLESMGELQKEVDQLRQQKLAYEAAYAGQKQRPPYWGWLGNQTPYS